MYGKVSVIPSQCFPTACGFRSPGLLSRHGTHDRENGLRAIHRAGVPLARTICSAVPDARCRRNDVIEQGVPQLQLSVGHVTLRDELHEGAIPSMAELNDDIPERMAGRGPCDCGSPQKPGAFPWALCMPGPPVAGRRMFQSPGGLLLIHSVRSHGTQESCREILCGFVLRSRQTKVASRPARTLALPPFKSKLLRPATPMSSPFGAA